MSSEKNAVLLTGGADQQTRISHVLDIRGQHGIVGRFFAQLVRLSR